MKKIRVGANAKDQYVTQMITSIHVTGREDGYIAAVFNRPLVLVNNVSLFCVWRAHYAYRAVDKL